MADKIENTDTENKTLLIIGNGFDLAHHLPTNYGDFMELLVNIMNCGELFSKQNVFSFSETKKFLKNRRSVTCDYFQKKFEKSDIMKDFAILMDILTEFIIDYVSKIDYLSKIKFDRRKLDIIRFKSFELFKQIVSRNGRGIVESPDTLREDFVQYAQKRFNYSIEPEILRRWLGFVEKILKGLVFTSGGKSGKRGKNEETNVWLIYFKRLYNIYITNMDEEHAKTIYWVDFEKEILKIISYFDNNVSSLSELSANLRNLSLKESYLLTFWQVICKCVELDTEMEDFIKRLYNDLKIFIELFEEYLLLVVEPMIDDTFFDKPSEQAVLIRQIDKSFYQSPLYEQVDKIKPDYVISFNYTHTFEKLYSGKETSVCYIHGECRDGKYNNNKDNNMVMGINEYLPESDRDQKTDYAIFKKFIQRIRKKTITQKYANINPEEIGNVYIFGHSLDITDRDILEKFLKPENTSIHIFARNEISEGKRIQNLIKLISSEDVNKKSFENKIEFIRTENMP